MDADAVTEQMFIVHVLLYFLFFWVVEWKDGWRERQITYLPGKLI